MPRTFRLALVLISFLLPGAPAARALVTSPIGDGTRYLCVYTGSSAALGKILQGKILKVPFSTEAKTARAKAAFYRWRLLRAERRGNAAGIARYQRLYNRWQQIIAGIRQCRGQGAATTPTPTPTPAAPSTSCDVFNTSTRGATLYPRIINGSVCWGSSAVVKIVIRDRWGTSLAMCSGTAIRSRTVLTAAHCLSPQELKASAASVRVYTSSSAIDSTTFYVNPLFDINAQYVEANDLALVIVPQDLGVPTMPLLSSANFSSGEQAAIAGYGKTEYGTMEELRAGFMSLTSYTAESLVAEYRQSGSNTCVGDSGGPLAVLRSGRWHLAGVTSNGSDQACGVYGQPDTASFANVTSSSNQAFLSQYVQ